jgi:hypothetical protein
VVSVWPAAEGASVTLLTKPARQDSSDLSAFHAPKHRPLAALSSVVIDTSGGVPAGHLQCKYWCHAAAPLFIDYYRVSLYTVEWKFVGVMCLF